ncbi:rhodanese-like domain-containing protein [Marinicrinis lubricantis]|uniref:Rhodanese-like domain-containing protein n=1 Tax=Marinicrinis lubricantis TaxID=2086470 RepID=A0ABW1IQL9_9BACL
MNYKTITPQEVKNKLSQGEDLYIIDVREDEEVIHGMIPGAKHIPMGEIPNRLDEIPKDQEIIFVCRSGGRSGRVCEYLNHFGYSHIINMEGGMLEYAQDE